MKKSIFKIVLLFVVLISTQSFAQKMNSKVTNISFYSHTAVEDIRSSNTASVSVLDPSTGELVFSVPMQSFEFAIPLMQKHFNSSKFLDTKKNPRARLAGTITNINDIDFQKDGTYTANVSGDMTINGVTKNINEKATITVKGSSVKLDTKFDVTLADYEVAFQKGKPSTNIAKTIEVTAVAEY